MCHRNPYRIYSGSQLVNTTVFRRDSLTGPTHLLSRSTSQSQAVGTQMQRSTVATCRVEVMSSIPFLSLNHRNTILPILALEFLLNTRYSLWSQTRRGNPIFQVS